MMTEDASDFLILDDFSVTANYNSGTTVNGILDRAYVEVQGTESNRPVFTCALADVSGVNHGKSLVVGGTTYSVVGVQPDESRFMVKLILSE